MNRSSLLRVCGRIVLLSWFVVAMYFQQDVGLADNGDFWRSMQPISSGPVGLKTDRWNPGTEEWKQRYFSYWIPYWNLDWNASRPITSAVVLWAPGVLLNHVFFSSRVLYLPAVSLFPKALLLGILLLVFRWTDGHARYGPILLLTLALPATLVLSCRDYVAYLNTFYQESGGFVFLLAFLASLAVLTRRRSLAPFISALACVLLLSSCKRAYCYWSLVGVPLTFWARGVGKRVWKLPELGLCLGVMLVFVFSAAFVTGVTVLRFHPYHSLFYGVLPFSKNPPEHLRRLGMSDAIACVGLSAFTPAGNECIRRHYGELTFSATVLVIYWEPAAGWKLVRYALANMQDASVDGLGKYSQNDPRSRPLPVVPAKASEERYFSNGETGWLNAWSIIKYRLFPTGWFLVAALVAMAGCFVFGLKRAGLSKECSVVGLTATICCVVDLLVAVLGEGKADLIRHLFLANVLFDVGAIMFLNVLIALAFGRFANRERTGAPTPTSETGR